MPSGAQVIVGQLEDAGVEVVFGLPGVHNLALWDALRESPIRLVGVRHEQAAAYAADGYARATGRLGVALTTTGPGAANTLGAVGEAWASRQPVLVIATDIPTHLRRPGVWRGVLHEGTDQAAMFAPVVKRVVKVGAADELGHAVTEAARIALSPPMRPVYVEVPTDLLGAEVDETREPQPRGIVERRPDEEHMRRAAELLEHSRRPLIWAGGGALQADAGALWDEADVVLAIGTDLDGMMTQGWKQPQPPHLVTVNVDPVDASKNYLPDVLLEADAAAGAAALAERVTERGGRDAMAGRLRELSRAARVALAESDPEALEFLDVMDRALPKDALVVCDMCIP